MLLIGTGGLASDMLVTLCNEMNKEDIVLYNDIDDVSELFLNGHFRIITNKKDVQEYFLHTDNRFIVGIGDNFLREKMAGEFTSLGGINASYISKNAYLGPPTKIAAHGVFIMQFTSISMDVEVEEGSVIYLECGIGHSSHIGKYCMISSHVSMSMVKMGAYSTIGIGVKFKPDVELGSNCTVGTGAVVTKSFENDSIIYGIPAKQKSYDPVKK